MGRCVFCDKEGKWGGEEGKRDAMASHHMEPGSGGRYGRKGRQRGCDGIASYGAGGGGVWRGGVWAHAELAAAILLVVEVVFVEELVAAILEPTFAPVLGPKDS